MGGFGVNHFFVYHSNVKTKKAEEIKRGFAFLKILKILKSYKNSDPIFENYGSISFFKVASPKEKEAKRLQPQKKRPENIICVLQGSLI